MTTQVDKQKIKTIAAQMNALSERGQQKLFDELESRSEAVVIGEVVNSMASGFTKSDIAALRRKVNSTMKKRARKDPKAPKGASGAFIFFSRDKVRELKERENLTHKDATK